MKKFLFLIVAAALSWGCEDTPTDDSAAAEFRFEAPAVSEITGTTASVSCRAPHGEALLEALKAGFAYGTDADDADDYLTTAECRVSGDRIEAYLTGLQPERTYRVRAFLELDANTRISGPESEFVTSAVGADETVFEITSGKRTVIPASGMECTIAYDVVNPRGDETPEARCEASWVHSFVSSEPQPAVDEEDEARVSGTIVFVVDANEGAARTAAVVVSYPGTADRQVIVEQEAAAGGGDPEESQVITLDTDNEWPDHSYSAATCRFSGYDFSMEYVGDYGNGIQLKSGMGWIANDDDMGPIRRIELVYAGRTSDRNICLYLGDAPRPDGNRLEAVNNDGTYVFDCTASGEYRYFKLLNGSGASYLSSIRIFCGGEGGDTPNPPQPDAAPKFSAPSFSDVTHNGAAVSCAYTYAGTGSISSAWFVYKTSTGVEQRAEAASVQSPAAALLTGLNPSTLYSFALCLEIGGKIYRSEWTTFMTRSQSGGGSSATRYAGWPELPVEVENSDYYYATHLCPGFKIGSYQARNYTVCFSAEHHCPVWVAAPRHKCYEGGSGRSGYSKDPDIPSDIQYNSKSTGGGCNKGHMLGSHERTRSSEINKQVFYYSNIAPQYSSGFNTGGGGWNTLEDWIDGQVCSDTTYLVIGAYFDPYTDGYGISASPKKISFGGRNDVSCPTMFYIAALRTKRGNTGKSVMDCSADELKCAVFVRAHNNSLKGQKVTSREMMSVAELERLTGFEFFTNVPNAPKYDYNPSDWGL